MNNLSNSTKTSVTPIVTSVTPKRAVVVVKVFYFSKR